MIYYFCRQICLNILYTYQKKTRKHISSFAFCVPRYERMWQILLGVLFLSGCAIGSYSYVYPYCNNKVILQHAKTIVYWKFDYTQIIWTARLYSPRYTQKIIQNTRATSIAWQTVIIFILYLRDTKMPDGSYTDTVITNIFNLLLSQ